MQIVNNHDKDVFNGDSGTIQTINSSKKEIEILFEDRVVTYEEGELDESVLAYAATIHKSQGSEYPCVVIFLTTFPYPLLKRSLLYSAITRGKSLVVLVGQNQALSLGCPSNRSGQTVF